MIMGGTWTTVGQIHACLPTLGWRAQQGAGKIKRSAEETSTPQKLPPLSLSPRSRRHRLGIVADEVSCELRATSALHLHPARCMRRRSLTRLIPSFVRTAVASRFDANALPTRHVGALRRRSRGRPRSAGAETRVHGHRRMKWLHHWVGGRQLRLPGLVGASVRGGRPPDAPDALGAMSTAATTGLPTKSANSS